MVAQSVLIPEELIQRLEMVARESKRTKNSFIVEALERYLDDREDEAIALARLQDPETEWVDNAEARRELGLD